MKQRNIGDKLQMIDWHGERR